MPSGGAQQMLAVAVVDDDPGLRDSIGVLLEMSGMRCRQYDSAETFLADPRAFDQLGCLLVDQNFPGLMSGIDLLHRLSADGRLPPAILFSARLTERIIVEARMAGALAVLDKPVGPATLLSQLSTALSFSATHAA